MKVKTSRPSILQDERLNSNSKSHQKRLKGHRRMHELSKNEYVSSCSIMPSSCKNNYVGQNETALPKPEEAELLGMQYFTQKYLLRDDSQENLKQQMCMLLNRKKNQIQSLRIYRDQLKLIARNNVYNDSIRLSVQTLKEKANIQQKLTQYKAMIQKQIRSTDREMEALNQYQKFMINYLQAPSAHQNNNYLDIQKQQEVMLRNLQVEKDMLIRELAEQQKKNSKQIKAIQDQILSYRISIKQKEDDLRNLKAKICTLYIKLHSRNNSRTGSKSKDRNMSLSIRKFNNLNHIDVKQAFIGNNTFKGYSKEIIEKVSAQEELVKIKFLMSSGAHNAESNAKNREQLFFQCFYRGKEGIIHDDRSSQLVADNDATRDKISQTTEKFEQVYVKYLFSMKFFYKSKIVGVECRIKTDKGNKHIQIGNCNPNIEHELLTLINKKIVTLGSFWHGKQMIGVSVWYADRQKISNQGKKMSDEHDKKTKMKQQAYDEYYS